MRCWSVLLASGALGLTACDGQAPEPESAFTDLGEELLIRFEDNPDAEPGVCQPIVSFAKRSEDAFFPININFRMGAGSMSGAGFSLRSEGEPGVLTGLIVLNEAGQVQQPCGKFEVFLHELTCKDPDTFEVRDCPTLRVEGEERFASFSESAY